MGDLTLNIKNNLFRKKEKPIVALQSIVRQLMAGWIQSLDEFIFFGRYEKRGYVFWKIFSTMGV
jgi:hypothetical protein